MPGRGERHTSMVCLGDKQREPEQEKTPENCTVASDHSPKVSNKPKAQSEYVGERVDTLGFELVPDLKVSEHVQNVAAVSRLTGSQDECAMNTPC